MSTLSSPGRLFYALAVTLIGMQFVIYSDFNSLLFPLQPLLAGKNMILRSFGVLVVLCGLAMGLEKFAEQASFALASLFILVFILIHVPAIYAHPRDEEVWIHAGELVAIAMGAILFTVNFRINKLKKKPSRTFLKLGHWSLAIFGFTLLLFGIEHFVYTDYIASLIPSWILLSNFVTYLAGVLFVLIAVSFISRRRIHLSASLFAVMFIVIILVVHTPRLILNPHIHNEWTSGFIALAMCGIGFMIGGITPDPEDDSPKHFLDIDEKHFHIS